MVKNWLWHNRKEETVFRGEGTYFVCSKCQARNTIPLVLLGDILVAVIPFNVALAAVNQVRLIVLTAIIILGIYAFSLPQCIKIQLKQKEWSPAEDVGDFFLEHMPIIKAPINKGVFAIQMKSLPYYAFPQ